MAAVLLIVMPFGGVERPQLGISTLKARLNATGVPCDIAYLNLSFAAALGYDTYDWLTSHYDYSVLAGEWVFAHTLFARRARDEEAYLRDLLAGQAAMTPVQIRGLCRAKALAGPFLEYVFSSIDWWQYSIVGFTSTFEQNLPSLSLARRIKDRHPSTVIVFGGGNCGGDMGAQLHRSFPWVDYVFTGEADLSFPELVRRLGSGAASAADIPGCVRRDNGRSVATEPGPPLRDLDELPYPNYDDFLWQRALSGLARQTGVVLQIETSRGCWWGAKQHCTFCGLSRNEIAFRTKSPARTLAEIEYLSRRYRVNDIGAVDNILSMTFFDTVLPELKRRRLGVRLFYETKANLKRDQVKLLRDAGVTAIQPGIESLSGHVLELMRKGTRPLQNIQLLKWCAEIGVRVHWNILYGFPGEHAEDYVEALALMGALTHLPPATGAGPMRLDRFSPYFEMPERFGIRIRGALPAYHHIYPFDQTALDNLAYFFDYDFDGKDDVSRRSVPLHLAVHGWRTRHPYSRLEVITRAPDEMLVWDSRHDSPHQTYRFTEPEKTVIDLTSAACTFDHIHRQLEQRRGTSASSREWLRGFLGYLVDRRLMVHDGNRYLSVILSCAPMPTQ